MPEPQTTDSPKNQRGWSKQFNNIENIIKIKPDKQKSYYIHKWFRIPFTKFAILFVGVWP